MELPLWGYYQCGRTRAPGAGAKRLPGANLEAYMDHLELYLARMKEKKNWSRDHRRQIREEKHRGMIQFGNDWVPKEQCIDLGNGDYVLAPK